MRGDNEFKHVVFIPDTQYPFVHKPSEAAVMEYVEREQPDELIHLGDFGDFYSLGGYRKDPPSVRVFLKEEVRVNRQKLKDWAARVPKARKRLLAGNHEDRAFRYVSDHAAELSELEAFSIPSLLESEEAGWEVIEPYGEGFWVGKPGGLWVTHGEIVRKWSGASARAHVMEKYGHSIIHGHTHRLGAFFHTNERGQFVGYECGTLCDRKKTPRATRVADWQNGFAVAWVSTKSKRFHVDLISINNGGFVTGGKRYGK